MKLWFKNGQTSLILRVRILDVTSVIGAGKTGLTFSSSGLVISTIADNESAGTIYSQAGGTIETITTLGTFAAPTATKCRFKEVDSTNFPGLYEIQIADARWAVSGAKSVIVSLPPVSGLGTGPGWSEIQLTAVDPQDAVRGGMTALPNAAAAANGGLPTVDASNQVLANLTQWRGTQPNALQSGRVDSYIGAIASGVIAAASFAANALDAVWSTTTRTLSTGAITSATFAANALDAVWSSTIRTLSNGAITSSTFAANALDAVWSTGTRTLTGFGTLVADIWANGSRTLTGYGTLISDIWNNTTRSLTDKIGYQLADDAITSAKIQDGAITETKVSAGYIAAIWSYLRASAAALATTTIGRWLYDTLTAIQAKTSSISGSTVLIGGNIPINGVLTVYQDTDRKLVIGDALFDGQPFNNSVDLRTADSITFYCRFNSLTLMALTTADGKVTATGFNTAIVEPTHTDLEVTPNKYKCQLEADWNGDKEVLFDGWLNVLPDVR